jgi:hypothetical protein
VDKKLLQLGAVPTVGLRRKCQLHASNNLPAIASDENQARPDCGARQRPGPVRLDIRFAKGKHETDRCAALHDVAQQQI